MHETAEFQRLHDAYTTAWRRFVIAVDVWQSQEAESVAARQAAFGVEQAKCLYRESRNEFADYILLNNSKRCPNYAIFRSRVASFDQSSASPVT